MKTIFADYNARTEAGDICLTTHGSREDIGRLGAQPGDWAWLSDGDVIVGARLAIDPRYGLVGVPDWDTTVHLDDEDAGDFERIWRALSPLLNEDTASETDQPRVFELLTQMEHVAPPEVLEKSRGYISFRRALTLREMERPGLALLEIREARRLAPDDPERLFVYLDLLRTVNISTAVAEAHRMASSPDLPALVLSCCINVLADHAEQVPDTEFEPIAERILGWCRRLDQAPDRDAVEDSLLALAQFNRARVLLRWGRVPEAGEAFAEAHRLYPVGPMAEYFKGDRTHGDQASELARRVRRIAEQFPFRPVAA
jgi:hypothetical protein